MLPFLNRKKSEPLLSADDKKSEVDHSKEITVRIAEFLSKKAALLALQSSLEQLQALHALNEDAQSPQIPAVYEKIKANRIFKDLQQKEPLTLAQLDAAHTQLVDKNSQCLILKTAEGEKSGRDIYLANFTNANAALGKSLENTLLDINGSIKFWSEQTNAPAQASVKSSSIGYGAT